MSGKLAPSKSTVYVGNLPYSLTNSDLHKIFEKYGKVVKVTIIKDKETRESKGSAFVLYLERESAHKAVAAVNKKQMFGRTIKCAIAKDNGRAAEFIRRRDYPDKSRCYECGEYGHLSYCCPKNMLGDREQPKKKEKKRKRRKEEEDEEVDAEEEEYSDDGEDPYEYSLSAVIAECASLAEEQHQEQHKTSSGGIKKRKVIQKDTYFSDEDASD